MITKQEFIEEIERSINREGISDFIEFLKSTDFFSAPASTRYHEAYEGGLMEHSFKVYQELKNLAIMYCSRLDVTLNPESIALVALFHDVCKIGCYKTEMRWRKDEHQRWEQYPTYKFEEDYPFGGHGSKSVFLLQHYMQLTPDEASAINCHMGAWDSSKYNNPSPVYESNLLAWLLHVADEAATYAYKERS